MSEPIIINNTNSPDIDTLFIKVNDKVLENASRRRKIIDKLMGALDELCISPNDSKNGKLLEAQIAMVSTLDSLLKSDVGDIVNQTKLNLSKKNSDNFDEMSKQSISILKELRGIEMIKASGAPLEDSNVEEADEFLENIELTEISPEELKINN